MSRLCQGLRRNAQVLGCLQSNSSHQSTNFWAALLNWTTSSTQKGSSKHKRVCHRDGTSTSAFTLNFTFEILKHTETKRKQRRVIECGMGRKRPRNKEKWQRERNKQCWREIENERERNAEWKRGRGVCVCACVGMREKKRENGRRERGKYKFCSSLYKNSKIHTLI